MNRIKELDGIRAVAILLVIGCHYEGFARLFHGLPEFGWLGVDIFFVLSGFLITRILLDLRSRERPYRTFYSRRVSRIVPPYVAATIPVILLGLASHRYWVVSAQFLVSQILFLQAFLPHQMWLLGNLATHPRWYLLHIPPLLSYAHHLPLGVVGLHPALAGPASTYWSLSIEEYFYLLWAPIVLRRSRRSILLIGILICLLELTLRSIFPDYSSYFVIFFRFDTLLYGAFLAMLFERWQVKGTPRLAAPALAVLLLSSVLGLFAILWAIRPVIGLEIRSSPLFMVFGLPLIATATAALMGLLILTANSALWPNRILRSSPFQFIGTISYTMYLIHILVALLVMEVLSQLSRFGVHRFVMGEAVLSTVLSIFVARLSWHYFEKPLLRWKDRHFPRPNMDEPALN